MTEQRSELNTPPSPVVVQAKKSPIAYLKAALKIFIVIAAAAVVFVYKNELLGLLPPSKTEPWAHAGKIQSGLPPSPTKQELLEVFRNARQAMATGKDAEKYISSEMLWIANNAVTSTGDTKDGLPVNTIEQRSQYEYFTWMLSVLPQEDSLEFGDLLVAQGSDDHNSPEFYYIDPKTHETRKFVVTQWKYWASLPVTSRVEGGDPTRGEVRFVYDNKEWKYHFENWSKQP